MVYALCTKCGNTNITNSAAYYVLDVALKELFLRKKTVVSFILSTYYREIFNILVDRDGRMYAPLSVCCRGLGE